MRHPLTRRQFVRQTLGLAAGAACLGVTGCGEEEASSHPAVYAPRVSQEPVNIGKPDQYRRPGVYTQFSRTHGIFIVTNPYGMLVAIADACTCETNRLQQILDGEEEGGISIAEKIDFKGHEAKRKKERMASVDLDLTGAIEYSEASNMFRCLRHGTLYTSDGLVQRGIFKRDDKGNNKQHKWSLARCRLRLAATHANPTQDLLVDPRFRYLHEKNDWSSPDCMHAFH